MNELSKRRAVLRALLAVACLLRVAVLPLQAGEGPGADQPAAAGQEQGSPEKGPEDALAAARQSVEADPSSAEAHVRLGTLLLENNAPDEAEKAFAGALELNPRLHAAMTGKGMALARMGRDQEAEATLRKALLLNPNPVRTHYALGLLYEQRGDLDQALSEYKKGIDKSKQGRK